jgi:zona occludens toxin
MLVFNEGLPRSGKSYDAVKSHIVPALKAGRKVFARINGLNAEKIAEYIGETVERVNELLIPVSTAKVRTLFLASRDLSSEDQEWKIADELKNALFVIDECHEFYVADRAPINPAIEQFFALCGQNGMDGVLMSQWYRRLHSSVRARVERKNVFQKLTAVGMENKYQVGRFHTIAPDRFQKVSSETETYEPAIFPLYKGYADGASNVAVYKAGGKTVWHKIGKYAIFVVPLFLVGLYVLLHFFGSSSGLVRKTATVERPRPVGQPAVPASSLPTYAELQAKEAKEAAAKQSHGKMEAGQAYVFDLAEKGRARLAGVVSIPGADPVGVVEWRAGEGTAVDRLTFAQLRDLGVTVELHTYGVRLVAGKDAQIVTSWPVADAVAASSVSSGDTSSAAAAGAPVASAGGAGTDWGHKPVVQSYVPPELVKGPGLSSYTVLTN